MKKLIGSVFVAAMIAGATSSLVVADNPIVQTIYTADVAPMVHDGVMYVYAGHDEDELPSDFFNMKEWRCYSSTDMVNWKDCGSPLGYETFDWAKADAWAAQCIERNGKFYFYAPVVREDGERVIGVAVADNPTGPFEDAIGEPLFGPGYANIDPTVFIDDDGRAYLYWGGSNSLYYAELNEDMISLKSEIIKVDTSQGLNGPGGTEDDFYEAPWLYKRNSTYYMIYSGNICEAIYYATSDSPTGPWTHAGKIMNDQGWMPFTNHVGVVDYKEHSYIFYHNAALPGGWGYHRSVCVEEFQYNSDGTIPFVPFTKEGPAQIGELDPYVRTEAETIAWELGIETEAKNDGGVNIYAIENGDYIKVKGVDFGEGAATFSAGVACGFAEGSIELHLDSVDGEVIGELPVSYTGGIDSWREKMTTVSGAEGKHDLYLVFKGDASENLFEFDYWKFGKKSNGKILDGICVTVENPKIDKVEGKNTTAFSVKAMYSDGTTKDVTSEAVFTTAGDDIIDINNATVTGLNYGAETINVSYEGKTDVFDILVKDLDTEVTAKSLSVDKNTIEMLNGFSESYLVTVEYIDGHTEDVTNTVQLSYDTDILDVSNGTITAKSIGSTTIEISYKGEKGDLVKSQISVNVSNLNPFIQNEAEDYHEYNNVEVESCGEGGESIGYIKNGSWIKYNSVDFGTGAVLFETRLASATAGGNIELHLDSLDGPVVGIVEYSGGSNWQNWVTKSCEVNGVVGIHTLYLKFTGGEGNLFNMNWWKFTPGESEPVIKLDKIETKLVQGTSDTITAYIMPETDADITFTSSDTSVVTIGNTTYDSTTGKTSVKITASAQGTAQVTARADGAKLAVCTVTVSNVSDPVKYVIKNCNPIFEGPARVSYGNVIGYIDKGENGNPDGAVTFIANVDNDGFYKMNIYNAVWGETIASHIYTINADAENAITYEYPPTSWGWRLSGFCDEIKLNKGDNTIKIAFNSGAAEVEYIELQYLGDANVTTSPYIKNEAEAFRNQYGVQTEDCEEGGQNIGYIENGDWIMYKRVDFGTGAQRFEARVSSATTGGNIELHLDSLDGELIGTLDFDGSGGWQTWITEECEVAEVSGVHDLYLKFVGGSGNLFNVNWWQFTKKTTGTDPTVTPDPEAGKIISTITDSIENNVLKLSVNIKNNTEDELEATGIVALYDANNALKEIKSCDFKVGTASSVVIEPEFSMYDNMEEYYAKVFIWNSIRELVPLADVCVSGLY